MIENDIEYIEIEECTSTNDEVWKYSNRDKIIVVNAKKQLSGRGRYGRQWLNQANQNENLTFSILINTKKQKLTWVPLIAGIASIEVLLANKTYLSNHNFDDLRLKWPNDIYIQNFKIGGILCESRQQGSKNFFNTVIGIGINLFSHPNLSYPVKSSSLFKQEQLDNIDAATLASFKKNIILQTTKSIVDLVYHIDDFNILKNKWLSYAKLNQYSDSQIRDKDGNIIKIQALDLDQFGRLIAKTTKLESNETKIITLNQPIEEDSRF